MMTIVRSPIFIIGVVIGLAIGAAEALGGGEAWRIVVSGGIPIAYGAVVAALRQRGDSLSILAGRPVDERAAHLNQEAATWAFGITAVVVIAVIAVHIATRGDWFAYAAVALVMAVAYAGSLGILQTRH
jgi:hypothetical protein